MMPGGHQVRWEDSSLAVGAASILLPSAAEGSCPVKLGNPPILALTLLRHKGCTVLRTGSFLLHQCGALKSQDLVSNLSVACCRYCLKIRRHENMGGFSFSFCVSQVSATFQAIGVLGCSANKQHLQQAFKSWFERLSLGCKWAKVEL